MVMSSNKYLTLFIYSVRMIVANDFEVTVLPSLYKFPKLRIAFRMNLFLLITLNLNFYVVEITDRLYILRENEENTIYN